MQKITLKELWTRHLPSTGNLIKGTYIDTKLTPEETLDDAQIKEILSRDVEIQYAAMTELAVKTAVHRSDPTCACSVGTHIFFCNDKEREELEKKLIQTFVILSPLIDPMGNHAVGYSAAHLKPQAEACLCELEREHALDKFVAYFIPVNGVTPAATEAAAYIPENKNVADAWVCQELKESDFYSSIRKQINYESAAFFMTNGFSPEDLERDPYIQALLALGHEVFIPEYAKDETLGVFVK